MYNVVGDPLIGKEIICCICSRLSSINFFSVLIKPAIIKHNQSLIKKVFSVALYKSGLALYSEKGFFSIFSDQK